MTHIKRAAALAVLLLLLPLPRISAAEQPGSISVRMVFGGAPVPGGSITLYHVAGPGSDGRYISTPAFSGCGIDPNGSRSPDDARTMEAYAAENDVSGRTGDLGPKGTACFYGLEPGLYLLVQEKAAEGYLPVEPFFVSIPHLSDGVLYDHVEASPKCAPQSPSPGLPQTGQLRWPVALLTALGLLCLSAGLLLRRRGSNA